MTTVRSILRKTLCKYYCKGCVPCTGKPLHATNEEFACTEIKEVEREIRSLIADELEGLKVKENHFIPEWNDNSVKFNKAVEMCQSKIRDGKGG